MSLLSNFSQIDLSTLKAKEDYVFFNIPLVKVVYYPFSWIFSMLAIAIILFLQLNWNGNKNEALSFSKSMIGFIPLFITLILCRLTGYFGWALINNIYPEYQITPNKPTNNGHYYIAAFALLSLALCSWVYIIWVIDFVSFNSKRYA